MDYDRFISAASKTRTTSVLVQVQERINGSSGDNKIDASSGLANTFTYPFESIVITTTSGEKIQLEGELLNNALGYQPVPGVTELCDLLKVFQKAVHKPYAEIWDTFDVSIVSGAEEGLSRVVDMVMEVGASIVLEKYMFNAALLPLQPYRPHYLRIEGDENGMIPGELRMALLKCRKEKKHPMPKLLITNPAGGNPTGTLLTLERRKEIYEICSEFNILILEDDPYYFIQFQRNRVPSFLSIDTEGRVIRVDSFSKIISPGMRLGFVTGPKVLLERIQCHLHASILTPNSLSQVIILEFLKKLGSEGFLKHVDSIRDFYNARSKVMVKAAEKHLSGLCQWNRPAGGFFMWIKILGLEDSWDFALEKLSRHNFFVAPGRAFSPICDEKCPYIRVSYAYISDLEINKGFEILADTIKEELK